MKKISSRLPALLVLAAICGAPAAAAVMNSVKGTIRDQKTGRPIAGVRITLVSARAQANPIVLASDSDGAVYKNGIPTGSYDVSFDKEGYYPARSSIRLTIGDAYDISLSLEPVPGPGGGAAALLRGVVELVDAGQFAAGAETAAEAIRKEPANAMLYYYRGYCREKMGEAAAAIDDYGKAVERKPDFALALTSLGKLQARSGDFAAAAENYRKALDLRPGDLDALYNHGVCLVNLGRNAEAGAAFEKVLAADPAHADACYQLGIVLLGQGDMARAKECLRKFLALDPQHKDAATAQKILESLQ